MPYDISPVGDHQPLPGRRYLFDANIWIYTLEADQADKPTPQSSVYENFIERLRRAAGSPKIVLPAVVLSEAINRMLRNTYYPLFIKEHPTLAYRSDNDGYNYKHIYRQHDQFRIDYGSLLYNVKSYHNVIELINDSFDQFRVKDLFGKPSVDLDFNDFLIEQIARRSNYIVVTEDADFFVEGISILTANRKLLGKAK